MSIRCLRVYGEVLLHVHLSIHGSFSKLSLFGEGCIDQMAVVWYRLTLRSPAPGLQRVHWSMSL